MKETTCKGCGETLVGFGVCPDCPPDRPTMNRETWLNAMAALMAPRFEELGRPLPKFRVSIGWPSGGKDAPVTGECWHSSVSADDHFEIFLNPGRADSMQVAATLAHELNHCASGFECGHKGTFATIALELGFARPLTHATAETPEKLAAWIQPFIDKLGELPHAAINYERRGAIKVRRVPGAGVVRDLPPADDGDGDGPPINNRPPKQSTRLLKAACDADSEGGEPCGYTVRITKKWAQELGANCPLHGQMAVEGIDA